MQPRMILPAVLAAALATPALAQQAGPTVRLSTVMKADVTDAQGQSIGSVSDVVMNDRNGRMQYLIVDFADNMNAGEGLHAVPFGAVDVKTEGDKTSLVVDVTAEDLKGVEGFSEDNYPNFRDASVRQQLNKQFGVQPNKGNQNAGGQGNRGKGQRGNRAEMRDGESGDGASQQDGKPRMREGDSTEKSGETAKKRKGPVRPKFAEAKREPAKKPNGEEKGQTGSGEDKPEEKGQGQKAEDQKAEDQKAEGQKAEGEQPAGDGSQGSGEQPKAEIEPGQDTPKS